MSELPETLQNAIETILKSDSDKHSQWQTICRLCETEDVKPPVYRSLWDRCWGDWPIESRPMWIPPAPDDSNISAWMKQRNIHGYHAFHDWSAQDRTAFWCEFVKMRIENDDTSIVPANDMLEALDISDGIANAKWFAGRQMNIVTSCFAGNDPETTAIVARRPGGPIRETSFAQLRRLTNRISNSLQDAGFEKGDPIAVFLPMTELSVAIYLGIVQAGMAVVSIADSFAPPEIASRLKIAGAKAVFTYDLLTRAFKKHELYDRVTEATEIPAIVIADRDELTVELRSQDFDFDEFLSANEQFEPVLCDTDDTINILFSSGTTGDPKAIPWTHLTPIRCAVDGFVHQDIRPGQICAWPTNLGWMMGPWLIFASLINRATIALYEDIPMGRGFGKFVQEAKVNMLGVVPTIVRAWKKTRGMERFDWSAIQVFSSTGESSQAEDMFYLSSLAGMRPVIEYCGGTEIGGGYVTSVVCLPNVPAAFNTPSIGLDFILLDSDRNPSDEGEVFLVPPSPGLSSRLLNRDHHKTYYEGTPEVSGYPLLRRHGDHFRRIDGSALGIADLKFYSAGGRVDDTMNLGGIKVSSAEIERILNSIDGIRETAAIAVSVNGGPDQLEVFAVREDESDDEASGIVEEMNNLLRDNLNPLFRVKQIHFVESMPRTASNKLMRRELRSQLTGN